MATSLAPDPKQGEARFRARPGCARDLTEMAALAGVGVTLSVRRGQTIVIEGDPIRHCFRIVAGTVRLCKAIADGRRQVVDFLGAGQCFGLTGLERHETHWSDPLTPAELIELAKSRSYYLRANEATRAKVLGNLSWYLHDHLAYAGTSVIQLPYYTQTWRAFKA